MGRALVKENGMGLARYTIDLYCEDIYVDHDGEWVKLADVLALVEGMVSYSSNPANCEGFMECKTRLLADLKETP